MSEQLEKEEEESLGAAKEFDELVEAIKKPARTNILNEIKFEREIDRLIFDRLPLSDIQKEDILLDLYSVDKPSDIEATTADIIIDRVEVPCCKTTPVDSLVDIISESSESRV